jgi:PAS domain S-box-containing protein
MMSKQSNANRIYARDCAEDEISDLKQKVARLEESERKLREQQAMYIQMLDAIHDMILVKDPESRILYANKSFRDFYAMNLEELQGIVDAPFNRPEYTEQYLIDDAYVFNTGKKLVISEEPVTRHDGAISYFNTIKTPIFNSRGEAEQMVAVCRDVTEKKLAEEERKRTERALDEAERLFREMAESMRDVFFVAEPSFGKYLYVSPAYERTWGRPCKELLDDPNSFVNAILPVDRPLFLHKLDMVKQSLTNDLNHEFRIQRDEQVRWIWCRTFPVIDSSGNVIRICGIAHDITDRKEVEKRVSEFNGMVSHELRTPLTSIRAALGLIEGGQTEPVGDGTMELITIARSECDRLVRLINDLLDIKKIEADKLELKIQRLQPNDILGDVLNTLRGIAQQGSISLVAEATDVYFEGDRDRLIQVLTNLVSNAVKFSPENCSVVVRVASTGHERVRFSVSDSGPGIPEFAREKLFTAFHQVDSSDSRAKGGTGLGLAISKAIVEQHGGDIGFDTTDSGGSTFWFELKQIG